MWNAALLAANLIDSGKFSVLDESILELGAGAGLPGILSALNGAKLVVLSDYESPMLLTNLRRNVEENLPKTLRDKVKVEGHVWGQSVASITQYVNTTLLIDHY